MVTKGKKLVKPKINKAFRENIPKDKKTQANPTLSDKSGGIPDRHSTHSQKTQRKS
jgi:hypothetical protein